MANETSAGGKSCGESGTMQAIAKSVGLVRLNNRLARHASDHASHALVFRCFLPFLLSSQCLAMELFGTKSSLESLREKKRKRSG